MKKWNTPNIEEMNINETAHNWFGKHWDGGYIGDGIISGHLGNGDDDKDSGTTGGDATEKLS